MQRWPVEHHARSQEEFDRREQALMWQHHQHLQMQPYQHEQPVPPAYPPAYYHYVPEGNRSGSEDSSSRSMPVSITSAPLPHPSVSYDPSDPSLRPVDRYGRLVIRKDLLVQGLKANGQPKRPMNAFIIYGRHRRPEIAKMKRDRPFSTGEISGILSVEWSNMDREYKALWLEQARLLREIFNARYPDYVFERSANGTRKHGSRGGKVPGRPVKHSPPTTNDVGPAAGSGWNPVYYDT